MSVDMNLEWMNPIPKRNCAVYHLIDTATGRVVGTVRQIAADVVASAELAGRCPHGDYLGDYATVDQAKMAVEKAAAEPPRTEDPKMDAYFEKMEATMRRLTNSTPPVAAAPRRARRANPAK